MKQHKNKIIIAAIILVIIIAVYFNWNSPKVQAIKDKFKKPAPTVVPNTESLDKNFNVQVADTSNDKFPLNIGSKGERVKTVQVAVNKLIDKQNDYANTVYPALVPDGVFGAKTSEMILKVAGMAYLSGTGMTETNFNSLIQLSNK